MLIEDVLIVLIEDVLIVLIEDVLIDANRVTMLIDANRAMLIEDTHQSANRGHPPILTMLIEDTHQSANRGHPPILTPRETRSNGQMLLFREYFYFTFSEFWSAGRVQSILTERYALRGTTGPRAWLQRIRCLGISAWLVQALRYNLRNADCPTLQNLPVD